MVTIRVRSSTSQVTFAAVEAVLFDKDGTLADVAAYLTALGYERAQKISDCATSAEQSETVRSSVLAAFGLGPTGIDPAGLLAVGSRHENEIAAAVCLAMASHGFASDRAAGRNSCGWIAALKATQAAFAAADAVLSPKQIQTPLLPDAASLLRQLKGSGLMIGVVSSDVHDEVAAFVSHYQLTEVDWYCGASSTTLAKTHPDFLQLACQAIDASPSATLVIGDSAADYVLSTYGSAGFIGMTGGWEGFTQLPEAIAKVSTLSQITVLD